jgi:hypothetical protein
MREVTRLLVWSLLIVFTLVHFRLFCGSHGLCLLSLLLRWYLLVAGGLGLAEGG